jgi:hypothetical protein
MSGAFDVIMRIVNSLLGVVMILMGCVWMMQGLNVGPAAILQGFMVNDIHWTYYGAILAVVGIAEIVWANTRRRAR